MTPYRTSYVKLIDAWLIVSLMVPFVEIIVQTVINLLHEDNNEDNNVMFVRRSIHLNFNTLFSKIFSGALRQWFHTTY